MDTSSTGISPSATPAEAPNTPTSGSPSTPATPAPASTPQATPAEPYLKVSDRTVYHTREDAVKAYQEAEKRITSLSAWEKLYAAPDKGGYGFTGITKPEDLVPLLDELIELRGKQATTGATPQPGAAQPGGVEQLSPEWQAYIKTLTEKGGLVTQQQLAELRQGLDQLSQANAGEQEAREKAAVDHGTSLIAAKMKEVGLPEDPETLKEIGNSIGGKWNAESYDRNGQLIRDSVIDRFIRGNEATRKQLIDESFAFYLKFGDTFAKVKTAEYAKQKESAQATTPRPLPQGGSPAPATAPAGKNSRGFNDTADINRRAREAMINAEAALSR